MLPSPISIETSGPRIDAAAPDSRRPVRSSHGVAQRAVLALIRGYQLAFSPFYAGSCRYVPSCSAYAQEAVERFGAMRGGLLAVRRLARCHPFGGHGLDPVPPATHPGADGKTVDL